MRWFGSTIVGLSPVVVGIGKVSGGWNGEAPLNGSAIVFGPGLKVDAAGRIEGVPSVLLMTPSSTVAS